MVHRGVVGLGKTLKNTAACVDGIAISTGVLAIKTVSDTLFARDARVVKPLVTRIMSFW